MPLARIRTESRELALDLAEELYDLGYTVETISPAEYRDGAADLEIQLEACEPNQLTSLVASIGEKYKKVFLAEDVIDQLPLHSPVFIPERRPVAQQPIAFVEVAAPAEVAPPTELAHFVESAKPLIPPESPAARPPVLATAESDPYVQQSTGRTRRFAELVASVGTTLGRTGLFVSDKVDDLRERLSALRVELTRRRQARTERLQLQRKRAAEVAAAEAVKRESEREARRATEPAVQPAPVAPALPKQAVRPRSTPAFTASAGGMRPSRIPISGRVRSRLAKANSRGRQLRNSPAFALKFGAAVGLVGMVLLIAYANRRPPTPVGLGELTRSTTVKQSAPFGSAEIKAAAAQAIVPAPPQPKLSQAKAVKASVKSSLSTAADVDYDEPEVVVRHYAPAQRKPEVNTAKDDGIKRFSDLD
jgi:hypothetical protein